MARASRIGGAGLGGLRAANVSSATRCAPQDRYHTSRKQIYQRRAKLASEAPPGVYSSHTKYADEAVRIKSTGRLAF